jgi:hypothetical protein
MTVQCTHRIMDTVHFDRIRPLEKSGSVLKLAASLKKHLF